MCMEPTPWESAVKFHGHICPGIAIGYRVVMVAMREMYFENIPQMDRWAVVDNKICPCGVDAIQVIAGCTTGNNNLLVREKRDEVYYFGVKDKPEALKILLKDSVWPAGDFFELRERVNTGKAEEEEKEQFRRSIALESQRVLEMPEEEFCAFSAVELCFNDLKEKQDDCRCQ
ncbi:MAG: FmdE family protein [Candidatus Contubernalis sp.]|nr:FmdE family protein [Candidatus Contubernalis sp.]